MLQVRGISVEREQVLDGALHSVYSEYIQMSEPLTLSQSDKRPMYLQIMEQIRQRIAVGDWKEGKPIPSIRQLAADTAAEGRLL